MAPSAIAGRDLLLIFHGFLVAADALPMIGLFEIQSGFRPVAGGTLDFFVPRFQFAFVQDIFPLLIEMMTVLTGQSLLDMEVMWKGDRRPPFP
jgi:hypothetical protein